MLEFKKEAKDCVSLDRKLMDEKNCIERRILKADLNSQLKRMQLEICFCFVVSTIDINKFFSSSKSQFYFLTPLYDSTSNIFSIPGDDGREAGVISGVPAQMVDRALVADRSQDPLMLRASGQGCLILVKYTARIQPTFIVRTPDHPPSSPV